MRWYRGKEVESGGVGGGECKIKPVDGVVQTQQPSKPADPSHSRQCFPPVWSSPLLAATHHGHPSPVGPSLSEPHLALWPMVQSSGAAWAGPAWPLTGPCRRPSVGPLLLLWKPWKNFYSSIIFKPLPLAPPPTFFFHVKQSHSCPNCSNFIVTLSLSYSYYPLCVSFPFFLLSLSLSSALTPTPPQPLPPAASLSRWPAVTESGA